MPRTTTARRLLLALSVAVVAGLTLRQSSFVAFTGLTPYDDEGYLLVSLRAYARGGVLYDQVYTQYGPFYYQLLSSIFGTFGITFTHTTGRLFTMAVWVAASVLSGLTTYRLTESLALALGTQLLVFAGLVPLAYEPPHPGGVLCLIVSAITLCGSFLGTAKGAVAAALIGALTAAALLIKINVGGLILTSVLLALVTGVRLRNRSLLAARLAVVAAALLIAPVLMARGLATTPWVRAYAVVVSCALLAVIVTRLTAPAVDEVELREVVVSLLTLAVAAALGCGAALARGTSAEGLLHGVVLDPMRQPSVFSIPLGLPPFAPWWALLCLVLSGLFTLGRRGWLLRRSAVAALHGSAQVLGGATMWLAAAGRVSHPLAVSLPLAWIALGIPQPGTGRDRRSAGKFLLIALAVLQTLQVYPVPGSQVAWATFLLVPVGAVAIAEGWSRAAIAARRWSFVTSPRWAALTAVLAVGVVAAAGGEVLYRQGRQVEAAYYSGIPLGLRGAERVRVSRSYVRVYRWLTYSLALRCATFVTMPGINSLYLFTGKEPPTMLNAGAWTTLFTAAQQAEVRDRFARSPPPRCVVRNQLLAQLWTQGRTLPDGPLARYVNSEFVPVGAVGDYELLVQRSVLGPGPPQVSSGAPSASDDRR